MPIRGPDPTPIDNPRKINDLDLKTSGGWSGGPEKKALGEALRERDWLRQAWGKAKLLRFLAFLGARMGKRTLFKRKLVAGVGFEPTTFRL